MAWAEKYHFIIPRDANGKLDASNATTFVTDAHQAGLRVHPYTFRAENRFLPANYQSSADPNALGDSEGETKVFLGTGIDGFFTDQANIGVGARNAFVGPN